MNKPEKRSRSKLYVIGLGIALLTLTWISVTVIYPLVLGDGLSAYNGAPRAIAEKILNLQYTTFTSSPAPNFVQQVHIDKVRPVSEAEISKYCTDASYVTKDPNNYRFYTVVTTERHLFAFGSTTAAYIGCEPQGVQREEFGIPPSAVNDTPSVTGSNGLIITH